MSNIKKFEELTKNELTLIEGGIALAPLLWFNLLPKSKSKNTISLVVL
ncbi:TPA: bacteriocin [Streptococcus suis]|nr:bacteriocin [Streptococcus suis]NQM14417.1 bacteriocin [Streptococcus suis]HEM4177338.1 bacteriocin [Streptococcus suis]HEM4990518.1 bacteriocin [Streptococcus suis]HEM5070932.1 bacteriocin [Streptococcus suis]